MNNDSIQFLLSQFLSVGTLKKFLFQKNNIEYHVNAHCLSTDYGYFVLFQADYFSDTNEFVEQMVYRLCQLRLNVVPVAMCKLLSSGDYQLTTDVSPFGEAYLNKFALVHVALKGDVEFYERWFSSRSNLEFIAQAK